MKFEIEKKEINKVNLCRSLNYKIHKKGEDFNCVKPLDNRSFPRFHLFIEEEDDMLKFKLHLDQKRSSYEGSNAHSGEYDSKRVEQEAERIKSKIKSL
ncbi:MAG: hypothetical protein V5A57_00155 [Candidatus Paceibacterota bacterium]